MRMVCSLLALVLAENVLGALSTSLDDDTFLRGRAALHDASDDARMLSEWHRDWHRKLTHQTSQSYRRLKSDEILPIWTWAPNDQCSGGENCVSKDSNGLKTFKASSCSCSEQVHLAPGGQNEMIVQFVQKDHAEGPTKVRFRTADAASNFQSLIGMSTTTGKCEKLPIDYALVDGKSQGEYNLLTAKSYGYTLPQPTTMKSVGIESPRFDDQVKWFDTQVLPKTDAMFSDKREDPVLEKDVTGHYSTVICTAKLQNLQPRTKYVYQIEKDDRLHSFLSLPSPGASSARPGDLGVAPGGKPKLTLGLMSDVGQTIISNASISILAELQPDLVLHAGDLTYADGMMARWDSFGRMVEALSSQFPTLHVPGNHDVLKKYGESGDNMHMRYTMPYKQSDGPNPSAFSVDVGIVHVIGLNSYEYFKIDSSCDFKKAIGDPQEQKAWLERDLANVDRAKTPWVVVMMHVPFYDSNYAKYHKDRYHNEEETYCSQQHLEPLLNKYGVDIVVDGHVHAYERSHPVMCSDEAACNPRTAEVSACGTTYITLGDGGNHEPAEGFWVDPQPEWSAYREASFGVGALSIMNETHAYFEWKRHACANYTNGYQSNFDQSSPYGRGYTMGASCEVQSLVQITISIQANTAMPLTESDTDPFKYGEDFCNSEADCKEGKSTCDMRVHKCRVPTTKVHPAKLSYMRVFSSALGMPVQDVDCMPLEKSDASGLRCEIFADQHPPGDNKNYDDTSYDNWAPKGMNKVVAPAAGAIGANEAGEIVDQAQNSKLKIALAKQMKEDPELARGLADFEISTLQPHATENAGWIMPKAGNDKGNDHTWIERAPRELCPNKHKGKAAGSKKANEKPPVLGAAPGNPDAGVLSKKTTSKKAACSDGCIAGAVIGSIAGLSILGYACMMLTNKGQGAAPKGIEKPVAFAEGERNLRTHS